MIDAVAESTVELVAQTGDSPDLAARWRAWREAWENKLVDAVTRNPLESLGILLTGGAVLFYAAEVGTNPRVKTFWDSLYYISTCASVGYANVFASTQAGKAVASVVFAFGPALCAKVFDRPSAGTASEPALQAIVARLDAILCELRQART